MAALLYRSRSEESAKRKQPKPTSKPQMASRSTKRKADADPTIYKKVCLCFEVSDLVAKLPLADLQAAKEFVEAKLKLKNPTVAQQV